MRFDLTDLRLFLLVLETGSITHGAALANMSLPSASARLRGMEELIGLPLLERRARGVELTPAGDTLAHHARLVLAQMEQMRGELGEYSKGFKAHVRLWVNTVAMTEFLPKALAPFLAARPNIDVDLKERPSTDIVKAVSLGTADIGIISTTADHGSLQLFPFATDRLVLVAPRGDPLVKQKRVAFQHTAGRQFVGLSVGNPLQNYLDEHAMRAGNPLSFRVRVRTLEAICHMVASGVGLAIVPETAARRCRRSMAIQSARLSDPWATRQLAICTRDADALPQYARELLEHLSAAGA
ncbi:MAG: transcriptional regulator, LysR family [Collimonas fungivorans]|uniref:LysR family transcriptional regulator n=1 Tax=Collimonas fungivorans TaxID=158899 RepID=UPI0026F35CF3|nr:LysR family transcriptional regulator [Collimonas fungivorans]MDB5768587.1 transcriptional regulator, LysR family [Collimonas fungivorans]